MKSKGTPKTLNQAISHAFSHYEHEGKVSKERLRKLIKVYVHDWIAQNIQIIVFNLDSIPPHINKAFNRLLSKK